MASKILYPPLVDNYTPAFTNDECRLYFSLSKFSAPLSVVKGIHVAISKQSSGESVVDNPNNIIILDNVINTTDKENLYYITIKNSDIRNGWTKGWVYKIQMRFSTVAYAGNGKDVADWLASNANNFSEWSTYTITKAIYEPEITLPTFGYSSQTGMDTVNSQEEYQIASTTLELFGSYSNQDASEILYSYRMKLKDNNNNLLEDTNLIYANQYIPNQFYYLFTRELDDGQTYYLELEYETLNKFTETIILKFQCLLAKVDVDNIVLLTAEDPRMAPYTSIHAEECDGRIGLKLFSEYETPYFGNVCIRRADSRTNFTQWHDIAMLSIEVAGLQDINSLPLVYDYTIESGVWYKYGLQFIDVFGNRSALIENSPIKREFEYAFLLGENNQQLRLEYNNTLSNVKNNFSDSKFNTLGSKYPYITRNGNMNYKSFSLSGLISFNMDENYLFATLDDIYKYSEISAMYQNQFRGMYDYTREREFRDKVLAFLQDGKPKLFKSPTEGNIVVRLMNINTTPNQQLGRLISNFSAEANEIAEPTMKNYLKYNFYKIGDYEKEFAVTEQRLGQLQATVSLTNPQELLELISKKYNKQDTLGTDETVVSVENLELYLVSPGGPVNSPDAEVNGFILKINDSSLMVPDDYYYLGEYISLKPFFDKLFITQAGTMDAVQVIMNFTYTLKITPVAQRSIVQRRTTAYPGQFIKTLISTNPKQGEKVYSQICDKESYDGDTYFRRVNSIWYKSIEAPPGAVFRIWDKNDIIVPPEEHIMNDSGILDLNEFSEIKDIEFRGMVVEDETTGEIYVNYAAAADVIIDYTIYIVEAYYQ